MKVSASLLALAAVLLPSAPAWSSVYSVDWTGIIYDGDDATGVFGRAASLVGKTVHLIFRVDTQTPGELRFQDPDGTGVWGKDAFAPVTASVVINGVTFELMNKPVYVPSPPFDIYQSYEIDPYRGGAFESDSATDWLSQSVSQIDDIQVFSNESAISNYFNDYANADVSSYFSDFVDGDVETAPIAHVFTIEDQVSAYFNIGEDYSQQFFDGRPTDYKYYNFAFGKFTPTSYTVTVENAGAAVPEPAAWTLMILGFGAVGAALRQTMKSTGSSPRRCHTMHDRGPR